MRTVRGSILALFLIALAVRVAAALVTGIGGGPVEDERGYSLLAESLARGDGFLLPLPPGPEFADVAARTSFRAPLWPLVLAPVSALGGGVVAFRIVAMLIGAAAAPLLWIVLRRTALRDVAFWTALAFAASPPAVFLSLRALSEPLAAALTLCALAVPPDDPGRARRSALAGVFLGLAVLTRPAALLPAVALCAARGGWRRGLACLAACLLVVAPWVARNAAIHGRPLLTTNSGVTLVGANCESALRADFPGKWLPPERAYAGSPTAPDLGMWGWRTLSEEASDRRFTADAVAFVTADQGAAARLVWHKLVRFVDPDTRSEKTDAAAKRILGWITWLPLFLLACAGLVPSIRGDPSLRPFAWLLGGVLATSLVFYADARMRSAADPALFAFAAAAVVLVARARLGPGRALR